MNETINKLKINTTYSTPSIGDSECIFKVKVISRTKKSVIIESMGETSRRFIQIYNGQEIIYPYGKYSMCAIIKADDIHKEKVIHTLENLDHDLGDFKRYKINSWPLSVERKDGVFVLYDLSNADRMASSSIKTFINILNGTVRLSALNWK